MVDKKLDKKVDKKTEKNYINVYCPRCGERLIRISEDRVQHVTDIREYDAHCDNCNININIEDRFAFEQEGNILITFT